MSSALRLPQSCSRQEISPGLTATERENLRHLLRHCEPEVFAAACAFRHSRDPAIAAAVVRGIVEYFTPADRRLLLHAAHSDLRLQEDLGLDSLTLLEIVSLAEDALGLCLNPSNPPSLRTLTDLIGPVRTSGTSPDLA
jgi:hypothetical protein